MIDNNSDEFVALIESEGNKNGIKWDDLIVRFEWNFDYKRMLESSKYDETMKAVLREIGEKFKYFFNEAMVDEWLSSATKGQTHEE